MLSVATRHCLNEYRGYDLSGKNDVKKAIIQRTHECLRAVMTVHPEHKKALTFIVKALYQSLKEQQVRLDFVINHFITQCF